MHNISLEWRQCYQSGQTRTERYLIQHQVICLVLGHLTQTCDDGMTQPGGAGQTCALF